MRRLHTRLHCSSPRPPRCVRDHSNSKGICFWEVIFILLFQRRLLYSLGDAENWTDLSSVSPLSIAYSMVQHMQLKSDAKLILVVEKDGIFKRLVEDRVDEHRKGKE